MGNIIMGVDNNKNTYTGPERRAIEDRRHNRDRRAIVRFEDVLGRRSGVERRLEAAGQSENSRPRRDHH